MKRMGRVADSAGESFKDVLKEVYRYLPSLREGDLVKLRRSKRGWILVTLGILVYVVIIVLYNCF